MILIKKTNTTKAFTLIELLVVIAIIGILATLAVVALSTARSSSRDAKRLADLKQLQTALEVYYNDYGSYPTLLSDLSSSFLPIKYLETIPTSPTPADGDCTATSNSYIYNTSYDKSSYSIHTCIGANTNSISKGLVVASPNGLVSWKCGENFLDERDNNSYKTIQFGNQCWFAQNINYDDGCSLNVLVNNTDSRWCGCYNNITNNCLIYGRLYQWSAAMAGSITDGAQGICPPGWHVPTSAEQTTLYNTINNEIKYRCNGVSGYISKAMTSSWGWESSTNTCATGNDQQLNNSSGFNALPAGWLSNSFGSISRETDFWSSSQNGSNYMFFYFYYLRSYFGVTNYPGYFGFSVRCLKD